MKNVPGICSYSKSNNNLISFKYIPQEFKEACDASLLNNLKKLPKLFDGMTFYISDHNTPCEIYKMKVTKQDLVNLIKAGGGKILYRAPALRTVEGIKFYPYHIERTSDLGMCSNYIIYLESNPPQLLYKMKELRHKSSRWLVDCILNFSILTSE